MNLLLKDLKIGKSLTIDTSWDFFSMDEVIEERFWRIFRNFQNLTVKQISDMPIEEMKDILDWLDKCYQTDLHYLNISEGEEN